MNRLISDPVRVASSTASPPRRAWRVGAFGGLLVAAVLAGWSAGRWSARSPADDSVEAGFARDMAVHHAQAVEMAMMILPRTRDPELRALATDIALTQQAQIGQLQGWLDAWGLPQTGRTAAMTWMGHPAQGLMPGMALPDEIARLRRASVPEAERQFLTLMIRHHEGGIAMARAAVERSRRPEVVRLASAMVQAQAVEITAMRALLTRRVP